MNNQTVDWEAYARKTGSNTHFHKLMTLLHEMNLCVYSAPVIDNNKIIVSMSDDFAFIFDIDGMSIDE